ncbi:unnamed protein product [Camellia sinensis]
MYSAILPPVSPYSDAVIVPLTIIRVEGVANPDQSYMRDDDKDEFNNDLESRIEGFIDKVIKGWKEELLLLGNLWKLSVIIG